MFVVFGSRSHLTIMVPTAWALRSAGHEVCVASQPNLTGAINDAGLTAVSIGEELDLSESIGAAWRPDGTFPGQTYTLSENRPEKLTWDYVHATFGLFSGMFGEWFGNDAVLDDAVRFARAWKPDLVVWDALTYCGPVVAAACGAAHARMVFGLDYLARMRAVFHRLAAEQPEDLRTDPMAHWLGHRLARYDAGPFTEDMVTGQVSIDPIPAWVQVETDEEAVPRLPIRYLPYGPRATVPALLRTRPQRPRVLLTLGLATRELGLPAPPLGELLEGLGRVDAEVIATLNAEQLSLVGTIPDNVTVFDFVALEVALPTCSAIVHHMGAGSTYSAVEFGVPQLCLRDEVNFWGEHDTARRVVERGAGLALGADELTADAVQQTLTKLLADPSFAEGAAALREETHQAPPPTGIVGALEALADRSRAALTR
ncbi:activator-dependent family glycosyltransferase [Amycolatopsis suaedae]|nr:activator-dependent family glycosyltransferase [Amycolatopsis suaedae]